MTDEREPRIASHPDDPTAPLADRLLLALGMWPKYVEELGVDAVLDAAVRIRSEAHRYPMVCEDWGALRDRHEALLTELRRLTAEEDGDGE